MSTKNESKQELSKKQKNWIYTGIFLAVVLVLFIVNNTRSEPESGPYPPGWEGKEAAMTDDKKEAPGFTLISTEGQEISLSDYEGKIVIVDFWATWCGPCRKGIPDLVELQKHYENDLQVVGVSLDAQTNTKDKVVPFMEEFGVNYPVVYGSMETAQKWENIRSIPTAFIIDREGNIVDKHIGLVPKSVYENKIKELLNKES